MNKTTIKNFAIWARNKLIADIVYQAGLLGVTEKGIAQPLPQSTNEVQFFDIGTKDYMTVRGKAIRQRNAFVAAIKAKQADTDYASAFRFVVEKVAYTWFNRLIAIRFMEVNDYLPGRVRVLSSENPSKTEPDVVTRPFDTDLSFSAQEQDEIMRMKDENKLDELFRMLFIKQCQKLHEVLPGLFDPQGIERVDSYLELLLTISFTDKDGVLWHLVHDIPEDDFNVEKEGQVEIIGWMYQYYNTEPKDQVFANLKKNIKISKDNIPAATQLFTPDWIVRYMVENSLGRLWVEGHPNEELKKNWKYYLEEAEQEPQVQVQLAEIRKGYAALRPEEIKVLDPCMGSGHILVYLFDVLMQIYESQGWTQREAAQSIVQNNLYGLDIDDRAAQLAYFAVMMKARQYDRRFLERGSVPHVYGIQESNGINREHIKLFGKGMSSLERNNAVNQLNEMLDALLDAKEYGSILNVPELDWNLMRNYSSEVDESGQMSMASVGAEEALEAVRGLIDQAQAMAQKYHVVSTNPPYMGSNGMGKKLSEYVRLRYSNSKSDMFSVFIERCSEMTNEKGIFSMITMPVFLTLTSFEQLRIDILNHSTIESLLHMGRGIFGIDFGSISFVIRNYSCDNYNGQYFRLHQRNFQYIESEDIEKSYLIAKQNHSTRIDYEKYDTEKGIEYALSASGQIVYYILNQKAFSMIPGTPIAYWVHKSLIKAFSNATSLGQIADAKVGLQTGDNDLFLKMWHEVDYNQITFSASSGENVKWIPYNKAGDYRRWYGNQTYVINWSDHGAAIIAHPGAYPRNMSFYFKEGYSWSDVSSGKLSVRYWPCGAIFDTCAPTLFPKSGNKAELIAFLNSKVGQQIMDILSPTIHYTTGAMMKVPFYSCSADVTSLVRASIKIAKSDWDSQETSWDFKKHPLLQGKKLLSEAYENWAEKCESRFRELKHNEETINKIYIELYEMGDEIDSKVNENDITVLRANKSRDIKSLISYAVGCMFGRYSLDVEGLVYAGGDWNPDKYLSFLSDLDNCIPITDEAYFEDDIVGRFVDFIRTAYGTDTLEENLDFIAKALGNKGQSSRQVIRNYFLNDFYKDHCATYSVTGSGKRPIYWLFDSGKQNGFKALVYMHRWNADTVGNLRVEYLHRMQRVYEKEIERMQDIIDNSRDNREVNQASKRREKLVKQLKEARDYDAKIAHVALSRVEIDLDDGVKVNYEKVQKGPDGKSLGILAKI